MKAPYLSVVIPCYNEEKNLRRGVLDEVDDYLKRQHYLSEVIVSDDGSTDGSLDFVSSYLKKHPRFRLLCNPHGGKPLAVRAGIQAAKGEVVLVTDMDQSTPINQFSKIEPFFAQGFEVVIGSRGYARKGFSPLRQIASRAFIILRKTLLLRGIDDTQCGFKAYKNQVVKDLFSRLLIFKVMEEARGWKVGAFDVEILFLAQKRGYKIAEVPIAWQDRDWAASDKGIKSKFLKESQQMLREILRVKINDLLRRYEKN